MDKAPPFFGLLATNLPLAARVTLEQLRSWLKINPWFRQCRIDDWFEIDPAVLEQIQVEYNREWARIGMQVMLLQPFTLHDKRFSDPTWRQPLFGSIAALYLLNSRFLMQLIDALVIENDRDRRRLRFLVDQMVAAFSPSNFLDFNPEALQRMAETQGASLYSGLLHLASDMQEGMLRQCDKGAFTVGVDLATTPGAVVYQNPLFQLIQYAPLSERQYRRPLLIVPPAINKYYILDLQAKNSMVRYLLEQGHSVFLVSWRNADMSIAEAGWDEYVEQGVMQAIRVVQGITGEERLNTLGYCMGGTLLCCALAILEAHNRQAAASLTLMTTLLDFEDTGDLGLFIDEDTVGYRERTIGGKGGHFGLYRGEDMANTFSMLRPNDLWWSYNVDKYLKGKKPRPLDLLYWNNDSTNLPGALFCWYLRHAYLQNELKTGHLVCCGERIDLSRLEMPAYLLGTREDHIVPWRSAYTSAHLLRGPRRFVLGASGHIAGVINPPAANKRSYWTQDELPGDPDTWLAGAQEQAGSWWPDWMQWLGEQDGMQEQIEPRTPGSSAFPVLEPAPGRYVKAS